MLNNLHNPNTIVRVRVQDIDLKLISHFHKHDIYIYIYIHIHTHNVLFLITNGYTNSKSPTQILNIWNQVMTLNVYKHFII